MALGLELIKILNRRYSPDSKIERKYRKYDLVFITNEDGDPIRLFIGKLNAEGQITGERYSRVLKKDAKGNILKDHWDNKGRSS